MTSLALANEWYEKFSLHADDLYPGRYTREYTFHLAELAQEIQALAKRKNSTIVAHNYLYPEFHELADHVGDSLGLSLVVREQKAERVDFASVYFMGATAKIICGESSRIFVADRPSVLGCSLVSGTDLPWIAEWKEKNPGGILVTYINSSAYLKSISDYITTSRNSAAILKHAAANHLGKRILFLPDKYLGWVMRAIAGLSLSVVDVYDHAHGGFQACCYVHEKVNGDVLEQALDQYPDAELLIHPECGCASTCLFKVQSGAIPHGKSYFLSTEQMVWHAKQSSAKEFVVATETGMLYRLRREVPEKKFHPVSDRIVCDYMKANTLEKLLASLREDRFEIILCDDCCDPQNPCEDDRVIHIQKSVANHARRAIERMLTIQ